VSDEPTPSELKRLIERNHTDNRELVVELRAQLTGAVQQISGQMRDYVTRELYAVELAAVRAELKEARADALEAKEELTSVRRGNRSAQLAAISAIVAGVIVAIILGVLKGTGH